MNMATITHGDLWELQLVGAIRTHVDQDGRPKTSKELSGELNTTHCPNGRTHSHEQLTTDAHKTIANEQKTARAVQQNIFVPILGHAQLCTDNATAHISNWVHQTANGKGELSQRLCTNNSST